MIFLDFAYVHSFPLLLSCIGNSKSLCIRSTRPSLLFCIFFELFNKALIFDVFVLLFAAIEFSVLGFFAYRYGLLETNNQYIHSVLRQA
jgi:hypothetical protein